MADRGEPLRARPHHLALLMFPGANVRKCTVVQAVMVLLCSKVPTVRNYAAERLYLAILMLQRQVGRNTTKESWSSATFSTVQTLLCSVHWGSVECVDTVKSVRDNILGAFCIASPVKNEKRKVKAPERKETDMSYKSLLYDFERGM